MQDSKFDVPSGYEDFVTSADDLLKQFQEVGVPDRCTYSIYFEKAVTITEALVVRSKILTTCSELASAYLWHKQSFNLSVSVHESSGLVFLSGTTEYSENVEDEWFIVYLLMNVSKQFKSLSISVSDSSDGQFLLIEAADHLDDWISPENTENRVWIRGGVVYVIPLDEPGKLKNGGLPLKNALEFFNSDNSANVARAKLNTAAHRSIAARTSLVYPTRIKALEHKFVCIMPRWAAVTFATHPQLLSHAVSAFSSCDSFTQPTKHNKSKGATSDSINTGSINKNNHEATILTVTLTRALFAQLTFKPNFKPPRHHHALMRRVSNAGSIKVRKAFDLGCRLVCGLEELCVSSAQVAIAANASEQETQYTTAREIDGIVYALQKGRYPEISLDALTSLYQSRLLSLFYDESHELDPETQEYQHMMHVQSLFQLPLHAPGSDGSQHHYRHEYVHCVVDQIVAQLPGSGDTSGVLCLKPEDAVVDSDSIEGGRIDREFFGVIANDTLRSDSDAWLYMSPEEMDAEMNNRMKQFAADNASPADAAHADEDPLEVNGVPEDQGQTMDEEQPTVNDASSSGINDASNMQDIVDGVKKFLRGKSDFEGISPKPFNSGSSSLSGRSVNDTSAAAVATTSVSVPPTAEIKQSGGLTLDGNYLQKLLAQNALHQAQAQQKSSSSVEMSVEPNADAVDNKKQTTAAGGGGATGKPRSGITMEQIDFHYNEELRNLQQYFSREDLEQFSSDGSDSDMNNDDDDDDDGDDYSGLDSDTESDDGEGNGTKQQQKYKSEGVFVNPTTVTGVAKATISSPSDTVGRFAGSAAAAALGGSKGWSAETESESSEPDSDDEPEQHQSQTIHTSISDGSGGYKRKLRMVEKTEGDSENENNEDEEEEDEELTDADYQAMMDMELFGQAAMAETFERRSAAAEGELGEVDVDLNLLKNLLESHSQGLGLPMGPASQLLAQFGIQMPRPPPMKTSNSGKKEGSSGTKSGVKKGK